MATNKTNDQKFKEDVLEAKEPVLVDFWAEWCGPCKAIGPSLEELSEEMATKLKIVKINVDENPSTSQAYGIRSIPALMIFKDGQKISEKMGALPKSYHELDTFREQFEIKGDDEKLLFLEELDKFLQDLEKKYQ